MGHTTEPKNQSRSESRFATQTLQRFPHSTRSDTAEEVAVYTFHRSVWLASSIPVRGSRTRTGNKRHPMFSWLDSHSLAIRSDSKLATAACGWSKFKTSFAGNDKPMIHDFVNVDRKSFPIACMVSLATVLIKRPQDVSAAYNPQQFLILNDW